MNVDVQQMSIYQTQEILTKRLGFVWIVNIELQKAIKTCGVKNQQIIGALQVDIKELSKPFPPEQISWRVGARTKDKSKGIALAYLDARDVMERLDSVVGAENWQCRYPFTGCCEISIRDEHGQWITKANCAGETQVEAEKGQASDAFKRAAVLWGIGRYLYDLPNTWVELNEYGNGFKNEKELTERLAKWQSMKFKEAA